MIKGTFEYLNSLADNYVCAEHATPVVVAWHKGENSYVLRCGHDHYPEEVTRLLSLTQRYKAGEEFPEPIKSNIEKSLRRNTMTQKSQPTAVTTWGVPAADLGTGELIPREMLTALVEYARKYELDPARGHVVLMYSKPYITIDGYLFHANQVNQPYKLKSRPLTDEERGTYQIEEGSHAWVAEIIKTSTDSSFIGLGVVTKTEMEAKSKRDTTKLASPVVAAHPWLLAQKRAEWQALRRAFPIGETEEAASDTAEKNQEA